MVDIQVGKTTTRMPRHHNHYLTYLTAAIQIASKDEHKPTGPKPRAQLMSDQLSSKILGGMHASRGFIRNNSLVPRHQSLLLMPLPRLAIILTAAPSSLRPLCKPQIVSQPGPSRPNPLVLICPTRCIKKYSHTVPPPLGATIHTHPFRFIHSRARLHRNATVMSHVRGGTARVGRCLKVPCALALACFL